MGFFSGFVHTFQKVGKAINKGFAKPLVKTFTSIPKIKLKNLALNVLKFGPVPGLTQSALEVAHPKIGAIHGAVLDTAATAFGKVGTGEAISLINAAKSKQLGYLPAAPKPTPAPTGANMAFNIGGLLGTISQGFSGFGGTVGKAIATGTGIAAQFIPPPRAANTALVAAPQYPAIPVMGRVPSVAGGAVAGAGAAVTRRFFNKFPNLAVAMQQLKDRGLKVNRARLYALIKRFGPEVAITGGILTAAAVNELMLAGPGRRRMNVGNVKALRRSMNRVEGFHKLCMRADMLRAKGKRRVKC